VLLCALHTEQSVHRDIAHTVCTSLSPPLSVYLQSICDDRQVLESNFLQKIRNSPDYRNMPEEEAVKVQLHHYRRHTL